MTVQGVFEAVLKASVYGSIVGCVILLIRCSIVRRVPARWKYLLWMILVLKLIFPAGPQSSMSLFGLINPPAAVTEEIKVQFFTLSEATVDRVKDLPATVHSSSAADVICIIWLAGAAVMLLWLIITFLSFRIMLCKNTLPVSDKILQTFAACRGLMGATGKIEPVLYAGICSPSLFGMVRPKILLPANFEKMSGRYAEYALMHELSHYKRKDIYINYLLLILQCIHWFNPLIWFFFRLMRRDMETATDEAAMTYLGREEYREYGFALIAAVEGIKRNRTIPGALGMAEGGSNIKRRIKMISKYKKPKLIWSVAAVLIIAAAAVFCLSTPPDTQEVSVLPQAVESNHADDVSPYAESHGELSAKNKQEEIITFATEAEGLTASAEAEELTALSEPLPTYASVATRDEPENTDGGYGTINIAADESMGPLDISRVISFSRNKPTTAAIVDLEQFYKVIDYNFDRNVTYTTKVCPDKRGNINIYFDSEFTSVVAQISIREAGGKEVYTCSVPTNKQVMYYLYFLDPDKVYEVSISGYCPGNYNISGKILIY